jgi:hypothetical protein
MPATILPDDRCPTCGYTLDAASPMPSNDREAPSPGDVALCFGCGEVLFFDLQMKHQVLPTLRLEALDEDLRETIRIGQTQIRALRARRAQGARA